MVTVSVLGTVLGTKAGILWWGCRDLILRVSLLMSVFEPCYWTSVAGSWLLNLGQEQEQELEQEQEQEQEQDQEHQQHRHQCQYQPQTERTCLARGT